MIAIAREGRAPALWALRVLLLLLLVADGRQEQADAAGVCEPSTQELTDAELTSYVLLELSSPAVRYLRAFTVPCWQPEPHLQGGPRLDGTWAVALVTLWNDLTSPNNGLGRLVTAQQLHAEAAAMLGEERYADSLAILELSVLLRLHPFQPPSPLPLWQRSMALAGAAHARVRLQLARTLVLVARARAGAGAAGVAAAGTLSSGDLELLEGAMLAGEAGQALFQMDNVQQEVGPADPAQLLELSQGISQQVAAALSSMALRDLVALAEGRGAPCSGQRSHRGALLRALLPVIKVPLQLIEPPGRGGALTVAPDPSAPSRFGRGRYPSDLDLYRAVVARVMALLPPALLQEVGIQCPAEAGSEGCRGPIEAQLQSQAAALAADAAQQGAAQQVEALLRHSEMVEEVLWRLEEVLQGAAAGVRMADGTTWLRQEGWTWQLAPMLEARLYPPGMAAPDHSDVWEKPPGTEQICLDKTFLLDTVVRLEVEELQGVQYALDNLHYAQGSVGGPERFWELAGSQKLDTGLDPSHRAQIAELLSSPKHSASVDFAEVLAGSASAGAADMRLEGDSKGDGAIAAVLSLCVLGAASMFVYGNRHSISAVLPAPWLGGGSAAARGGGGGGGAEAAGGRVAQRTSATAALREAIAAGDPRRLAAAIEAAEEAGVEKLLLKKARSAAQSLRKKRAQQGRQAPAAPQAPARQASSLSSPQSASLAEGVGTGAGPRSSSPPQQDTMHGARAQAGTSTAAVAAQRGASGSGVSGTNSSSATDAQNSSSRPPLGRSLSESAAQLVQATWGGAAGDSAPAASEHELEFMPAKRKPARREAAAAAAGRPAAAAAAGGTAAAAAGGTAVSPVRTGAALAAAAAATAAGGKHAAVDQAGQAKQPDAGYLSRNISSGSSEAPTSPGTPIEFHHCRTAPISQAEAGPSPRAPSPQLDTPLPSPTQSDPPVGLLPPPPPSHPPPHATATAKLHQPHPRPQPAAGVGPASGGGGGAGQAQQPSKAASSSAGPRVILALRPNRGSPAPGKAKVVVLSPQGKQPHRPPGAAVGGGNGGSKLPSPPPPPPPPGRAAGARPAGAAQPPTAASAPPPPEATVTFVPRPSDKSAPGAVPQKSQSAKAVLMTAKPGSGPAQPPAPSYRRTLSDSAARGAKGSRGGGSDAFFMPRPPPPPPPRPQQQSPRNSTGTGAAGGQQAAPTAAQPAQHSGRSGAGSLDSSPRTVGSYSSPYSSSEYGTPSHEPGRGEGALASRPLRMLPLASAWATAREHLGIAEGLNTSGAAPQYDPFGTPAPALFDAPNPFASAASTPSPRPLVSAASAFAAAGAAPAPALSPQPSLDLGLDSCSLAASLIGARRASAGTLFEGMHGGEGGSRQGLLHPPARSSSGPPALFGAGAGVQEGSNHHAMHAATSGLAPSSSLGIPGAHPELLASLQQIWSGSSPSSGEGGGARAGAEAGGLLRTASAPKPPLPSLLAGGGSAAAGAIAAGRSPASNLESALAPAPELALWSGSSSADSSSGIAGGVGPYSSVLASAWSPSHGIALLGAGGLEAGEEWEDCDEEGGESAQQAQRGMRKDVSLDLAMLGFTELGD